MAGELAEFFARTTVPQTRGPVPTSREYLLAVRGKGHPSDGGRMAGELAEFFACTTVPQARGLIPTPGEYLLAVRRKAHTCHSGRMPQLRDELRTIQLLHRARPDLQQMPQFRPNQAAPPPRHTKRQGGSSAALSICRGRYPRSRPCLPDCDTSFPRQSLLHLGCHLRSQIVGFGLLALAGERGDLLVALE